MRSKLFTEEMKVYNTYIFKWISVPVGEIVSALNFMIPLVLKGLCMLLVCICKRSGLTSFLRSVNSKYRKGQRALDCWLLAASLNIQ
jgi:hypothetical protein